MPITSQLIPYLIITAIAGLAVGALIVWLLSGRRVQLMRTETAVLQSRLKAQHDLDAEREAALKLAGERLSASFENLAGKSLKANMESFLTLARENLGRHQEHAKGELSQRQKAIEDLLKPISDALEKTEVQISEIEKERREAYGRIQTHLETMSRDQQALQLETRNLVKALRRPEVRGRWGELTLHRVVELAGMVEHCDFVEQEHVDTGEGGIRPDMIIRMPEQRELVVDVKTPLDAYLEAIEADSDEARDAALARHTRNVKERIRELASKNYWSQFKRSPEFVILFIPGEQFLAAALDQDPSLQEEAMRQRVFLTTPTSLVGLLKIVAYGWRQLTLAENAERIRDLGEELYGRLTAFTTHLAKLGRNLSQSVDAFNSAVGSLDRKVLPGARKFTEMGIQAKKPIPELDQIEKSTRKIETDHSTDDEITPRIVEKKREAGSGKREE